MLQLCSRTRVQFLFSDHRRTSFFIPLLLDFKYVLYKGFTYKLLLTTGRKSCYDSWPAVLLIIGFARFRIPQIGHLCGTSTKGFLAAKKLRHQMWLPGSSERPILEALMGGGQKELARFCLVSLLWGVFRRKKISSIMGLLASSSFR